jgi:hypothetical protein
MVAATVCQPQPVADAHSPTSAGDVINGGEWIVANGRDSHFSIVFQK